MSLACGLSCHQLHSDRELVVSHALCSVPSQIWSASMLQDTAAAAGGCTWVDAVKARASGAAIHAVPLDRSHQHHLPRAKPQFTSASAAFDQQYSLHGARHAAGLVSTPS